MPSKSALGLDENIAALLCYVNICLPIGLVVSILVIVQDKTNKLPRFHAFQSLLLGVLGVVIGIVLSVFYFIAILVDSIIASATGLPIPILFLLVALVGGVICIGLFIMLILAAVKAYGGQIYKIPIIGGFADKFSG